MRSRFLFSTFVLLYLQTGCGSTHRSCQRLSEACKGRAGDSCIESPECEWVAGCHRSHCANFVLSDSCETTGYCDYDDEAMQCIVREGKEVDQCAGLDDDVCEATPGCERRGCEKLENTPHCISIPPSECEDFDYCVLEEHYSGFRI